MKWLISFLTDIWEFLKHSSSDPSFDIAPPSDAIPDASVPEISAPDASISSGPEKSIDISKHQTFFDAQKCKDAGVTTVLCRLAYGASTDSKVSTYLPAAKSVGLTTGGYGFGTWHYASKCGGSIDTARKLMQEQVSVWIQIAKQYGCTSWIAIDQELEQDQSMGLSLNDNTILLGEAARLIENAGLSPCLYASASWIKTYVNLNTFTYPLWVAYYKWYGTEKNFDNVGYIFPAATGTYGAWMNQYKERICLWQFTSEGYADMYGCTHGSNGLDKNWLYFQPYASPVSNTIYFESHTGTSASIVDAFTSIGVDSSYSYRKMVAVANGIQNYTGTAAQNLTMLEYLKQGKLVKP